MRRTNEYTDFGLWVKNMLAKNCITQRELSIETGIKPGALSDVLVGRNKKKEHVAIIKFVLVDRNEKNAI